MGAVDIKHRPIWISEHDSLAVSLRKFDQSNLSSDGAAKLI